MKVLLIEDDPAEAILIQDAISSSPTKIELALETTLASGLASLADNPWRAVLLDLGLPDSEGTDTIKAVREANPHLPIVVLTGLDDTEAAMEAVTLGAQYYLVKGKASTRVITDALSHAVERAEIQVDLDKQRDVAPLPPSVARESLVRKKKGGIEELLDQVVATCEGGGRIIIVTTNRPGLTLIDKVLERLPDAVLGRDVSILDCTGHPPIDAPNGVYAIGSPTMLEAIGLRVEQILRVMGPSAGVIIDDLNTLAMYTNIAAVTEFSHYLTNRLRALGVSSQFMLSQGPDHDLIASRVNSFLSD